MAMSDRIGVMNNARLAQVDRPHTAYEHPEDNFVSSFLGKSNTFKGQVKSLFDGETLIDASGVEFLARTDQFEPGASVNVSVRPEKIQFCEPSKGQIDGVINTRIFLGNQWVFQVDSDIGEFVVVSQNTGREAIDEGHKVGLSWSAREVRALPLEKQA